MLIVVIRICFWLNARVSLFLLVMGFVTHQGPAQIIVLTPLLMLTLTWSFMCKLLINERSELSHNMKREAFLQWYGLCDWLPAGCCWDCNWCFKFYTEEFRSCQIAYCSSNWYNIYVSVETKYPAIHQSLDVWHKSKKLKKAFGKVHNVPLMLC